MGRMYWMKGRRDEEGMELRREEGGKKEEREEKREKSEVGEKETGKGGEGGLG